jgi:hypothetical protein
MTLCEKLPACASPLLLYAQEIEPHTGWHLGSFPQVFSHLALINACVHLIREDGRIAAGQVTRTGAPSPSRPVRTAAVDKPDYQCDIILIGDRVADTDSRQEASR